MVLYCVKCKREMDVPFGTECPVCENTLWAEKPNVDKVLAKAPAKPKPKPKAIAKPK